MITRQSLITTVKRAVPLLLSPPPPNRCGRSYAVTVITPIYHELVEELRKVLRGFDAGAGSPLDKVPHVQFARWVVIEQLRTDWPGAPSRTSRLKSPYLLFSADLTVPPTRTDGLPETFFRELAERIPIECAVIWGKCRGYPGVDPVDDFVTYLRSSQVEMGLYYAAFPDATPDEIERALKLRASLAQFVLEHQDAMIVAPASARADGLYQRLKDDYRAQAPSWGT